MSACCVCVNKFFFLLHNLRLNSYIRINSIIILFELSEKTSMDKMCDALVPMNSIRQKCKQEQDEGKFSVTATMISERDFDMHETNPKVSNTSTSNLLREEHVSRIHLSDQRIDQLSSRFVYFQSVGNNRIDLSLDIDSRDIQQLKTIDVNTMQDLLGCYLIHDTPKEFRSFLMKFYRITGKTASILTQLLHQWTRCHLDGIIENERI